MEPDAITTHFITHLAASERGTQALRDLLKFFDNGGLALDRKNQIAIAHILKAIYLTPSIRDQVRAAIEN